MTGNHKDDYVTTASNEKIFQEAAKRLKQLYFHATGGFIDTAVFELIFDAGRFLGINKSESHALYRGPSWPRLV